MTGMLEGKTILITGGGRGIGRATALVAAREGANVVVADLSADGIADTVSLVNEAGGQARAVTGDVTSAAEVDAMVKTVIDAFGRIDAAFNNAGIAAYQVDAAGKNTADWSEEAFDRMIDVNLKGVWLCMRAELRHMLEAGGGAIVNTASVAGLIGIRTSSAYTAAKHGVVGLTKTAAIEYGPDKIRINSVCPGFIETDMTKVTMQNRGDEIRGMIPFKRMGQPTEIAEMVCWLCSDHASYVSGANFNVDGGYAAQ
jgi:NAD(P)-dependent dehydrogenase (short-subunit alcohol dehydrogenase family)